MRPKLSAGARIGIILLKILVILVPAAFLSLCVFASNLWRLITIDYLAVHYSLPYWIQLFLLIVFILLIAFTVFKKSNRRMLILTGLSFVITLCATYNLTLSAGVNSIQSTIGPFVINDIPFADHWNIRKTWTGYKLASSTGETGRFWTDILFAGFHYKAINKELTSYGQCVEKKGDFCQQVDIYF